MNKRKGGVLLHITSLPGREGTGTFGKHAYRFVDFLSENGQRLWQILPLGPVGFGNSPYQCYSAFAGNPMLIDLAILEEETLLKKTDLENAPSFPKNNIDFEAVKIWKEQQLETAFGNFREKGGSWQTDYKKFINEHFWWLKDYALFMALKKHFGKQPWSEWDRDIKFRKKRALHKMSEKLSNAVDYHLFLQFLFFKQWFNLKEYANGKGIEIIGDVPLYVSGDSADVWTNPDIFLLDEELNPIEVGGVPPDYFSETGQLWGNPVFNWQRIKERDFDWWIARLHFNLNMFDQVRIDHFRGLESFWSIPAGEKTAINGKWVPALGYELLSKLKEQIGELPFIAEDLGIITPEVDKLRDDFNLPGMKVLQFAFSTDATHKDLPHNYAENFMAYTGTHDNDTTLGWIRSVKGREQKQVKKYLGWRNRKSLKKAIELAWSSAARSAIVPLQDLLLLNSKARMNVPGTSSGNWGWRFQWNQLKNKQKRFIRELTEKYNR